jgi:hypothetical protein
MSNEFKKTTKGQDVVYTLESATSGGTSSGAVATSINGKKSGGLLIQGSDPAVVRRNPVAKNVNKSSSGAGAHKDRKKAMKRGEVKHKKPFAEEGVAEESIDHEKIYGINLEPFIDYVKRKSGKLGAAKAMDNVKYSLEVYHNKQGEELNKILNAVKMAASGLGERRMSRAAKGVMKYGKDGMKALAKAGREGASEKKLDSIRDKHDHYNEEWSQKYKNSINCSHPKGFSQKAHCAGKKKHNESMTMEMVCSECGMCQTHGDLNEIKKGQKDSNGYTKCWPGHHAAGTKKGKNGGTVRNCVPNENLAESHPGNPGFGSSADNTVLSTTNWQHSAEGSNDGHTSQENGMMTSALKSLYKHAAKLRHAVKQMGNDQSLEPWQQAKVTKAADYLDSVFNAVDDDRDLGEGYYDNDPNTFGGAHRQWAADQKEHEKWKSRERNAGVEHEINNFQIVINGRNWKVFPGEHPADSAGEMRQLQRLQQMCARKSRESGKKWEVYITGAPATTEGHVNEAPIEMDPAEPMNPKIYGHQSVNPSTLKSRMIRAKGQLQDLAKKADNGSALDWVSITRHFPELAMNVEQIRHALDELSKVRKKGGIKSRGIDPNIGPLGESKINEKSTSEKQARTMAAAAHDPKFAKKLGIKPSVAKEFNKADTGTKQLSKAMKKHKKNEDSYTEELANKLSEKILQTNDPVEKYVDVFQKANYNQPGNYQFGKYNPQNRTPQKRERMAKAASYAAKTSKKK